MNRLMKAEWFRVRHSSGFMKWLFAACVVCTVFPPLINLEICKGTLAENLKASQLMISIFMPGLLAGFSAVIVGIGYRNKTAYYEVMAGNKIFQIIFSKVFVDAVLVSGSVLAVMGLYWIIIGCCNGIGQIGQLPLRLLLLFVVFFSVCANGILILTSFRRLIGAAAAYVWFTFVEVFFLFFIQSLEGRFSEAVMVRIGEWFTMIKLAKIISFEYEITGHLIFTVIAGMLIEGGVWYAISYRGMKKRLYE